jgi:hypothetical protein
MGRVTFVPFLVLAVIAVLALVGGEGKAFNNPSSVYCAYELAAYDSPPADVLIVGSSRIGHGLDPGYMMARIKAQTGKDITVERLGINNVGTIIPQFRPVLARYLAERGAPEHLFLQMVYNFLPHRQRTSDLPVNSPRNVSYASLAELIVIRKDARLNPYDTVLPRRFEAGYLSLPALVLQKIGINFYAALRYLPMRLRGKLDVCTGDQMFRQANPKWRYNQLEDGVTFREPEAKKQTHEHRLEVARDFLPLDPNGRFRQFETDQLHQLIDMLEAAGSTVHLMLMPALGDTELTSQEMAEITAAFPGNDLIHPYSLFEKDVGPDLAKSYVDTHHTTAFGALQYSRYFADVINRLDF